MLFSDALTLDAPRRTADGYMAVRARAARTGTYSYLGSEIDPENKHGLRDAGVVNVLRDDAAVFDQKSAHSFIGKPVTDNHPSVAVNAKNWRDHARGVVMGAMREGDYLAFDLLLTDGATIDAVDAGKRELSNGYAAELTFGDFEGPGGVKCVAKQVSIAGNHVAIVDKGRAGPSCAITDSVAICDANPAAMRGFTPPSEKPMKIRIGDAEVDATNGEAVRIANDAREAQFKDAVTRASTAETALATAQTAHDKAMAAKDTEIDALKAQVVDEATIDARAAAKADVVSKAKAILGDKAPDFAGKSIADVRRETVRIAKGDAAVADKSADYIEARFDGLTDAKPVVQPLGAPVIIGDAASKEAAALQSANDLNAWRKRA